MTDKRYLELVKRLRTNSSNLRKLAKTLDEHLDVSVKLTEALANVLSPKALVTIPVLTLAMTLFTKNWKQLLDIMDRAIELLEQDVGVPPPAPPPNSAPKN